MTFPDKDKVVLEICLDCYSRKDKKNVLGERVKKLLLTIEPIAEMDHESKVQSYTFSPRTLILRLVRPYPCVRVNYVLTVASATV